MLQQNITTNATAQYISEDTLLLSRYLRCLATLYYLHLRGGSLREVTIQSVPDVSSSYYQSNAQ